MASASVDQLPQQGAAAKAILYAFLANTGIALAKTWAAIYTGSSSMTAEAIHSFADAGNQVLLFLESSNRSARPIRSTRSGTASSAISGASLLR